MSSHSTQYPASLTGGVFAKPKRPMEFHVPGLQVNAHDTASNKQRKYLQLKEKIMRTDELIQKYRQKAGECDYYKQQLKEVQTKLSIEEKSRRGLVAELSIQHKENELLKREKETVRSQVERLQLNVKDEELVREQLMVQLNELRGQKDTSNQMKEDLATTKTEMEKYKRMYQKLKQEFEVYKAEVKAGRVPTRRRRRTSEANSLPASIISPPLPDPVLSPLSTCSLPLPTLAAGSLTTEPPLECCHDINRIDTRPQTVVQGSLDRFDPGVGPSLDKPNDFMDQFDCDTFDGDVSVNVSDVIAVENTDNNNGVCRTVSDENVKSLLNIGPTQLSDDSDSEEEDEDIPTLGAGLRSRTRPISSERAGASRLHIKDINTLTSSMTGDCGLEQPNLPTGSCSRESSKGDESSSWLSDRQGDLITELFGDYDDSLSHLSVSDSSSCCSQSSLGSVDDLGDLLRSNELSQEGDISEKTRTESATDGDQCDGSSTTAEKEGNFKDGAAGGSLVADARVDLPVRVLDTTPVTPFNEKLPRGEVSTEAGAQTDRYNHTTRPSQPTDVRNNKNCTGRDVGATGHNSSLGIVPPDMAVNEKRKTADCSSPSTAAVFDGPSSFLPRIEVEAVPADTASSEDSDCEMDVSFSTLFGDEFHAISPLPPSPYCARDPCLSAPLSPLPPSPTRREFLSPLPQTPQQDLEPISPLSCSPVAVRQPLISPLPQSPRRAPSLVKAESDVDGLESALSGESREENDSSPIQFDDAVPIDVRIPKPCSLSVLTTGTPEVMCLNSGAMVSPLCASGSQDAITSPRSGKLCVSKSSPFSPLSFVLPVPTEAVLTEVSAESKLTDNSISDASKTTTCVPLSTGTSASNVPVLPPDLEAPKLTDTCNSISDASKSSISPLKLVPTCDSVLADEGTISTPVFEAVPIPKRTKHNTISNSGGGDDLRSTVKHFCGKNLESVAVVVGADNVETRRCEEGSDKDKEQNESAVVVERKEMDTSSEAVSELVDHSERRMPIGDACKRVDVAVGREDACDGGALVDRSDNLSDGDRRLEPTSEVGGVNETSNIAAGKEKVDGGNDSGEVVIEPVDTNHITDGSTQPSLEKKNLESVESGCVSKEHTLKDEDIGCTKIVDGDTEITCDAAVSDVLSCETGGSKAALVGEDNPLSSETVECRMSPIEEGEICESDGDDETVMTADPAVAIYSNNTIASKNRNSLKLSGPPTPQRMQVESSSESMSVQHTGRLTVAEQQTLPCTPHPATVMASPPEKDNAANIRGNFEDVQSLKSSTTETFDDLLNTFCSKTRTTKKGGATAKMSLPQSSPNGPKPSLARLLSAARSKPKKITTAHTSKSGAAAIIGVESVTSVSTAPFAEWSRNGVDIGLLSEEVREKHTNGGQRKAVRHYEKEEADGGECDCVIPASKRAKVEDLAASNGGDTLRSTAEAQGKETVCDNSPLVATSLQCLPGHVKYRLRSRNVNKVEVFKRKRRKSSSGGGNSGDGNGGGEQPAKRNKTTKSCTSLSHDGDSKSDKTEKLDSAVAITRETVSSNVDVEEKTTEVMEQEHSAVDGLPPSDGATVEQSPVLSPSTIEKHPSDVSSPSIDTAIEKHSSDSGQQLTPTLLGEPAGSIHPLPPPGGDAATTNHLQPMTTSILADSCHLDDNSSDTDNDQPLVIGDLESLLDEQVDEAVPSTLPSRGAPIDSSVTKLRSLVRKTDSATGQEEDQTPASSPRTGSDVISRQLLCLSEQKNVAAAVTSNIPPPSSSSSSVVPQLPPPANLNVTSVGYGQPQRAPLPEYRGAPQTQHTKSGSVGAPSSTSSLSLIDDDDDVFCAPLPLLEKSQPVAPQLTTAQQQPSSGCGQSSGGSGGCGVSLAQRQLTVCMQCPLPLPPWLVAAMTRSQSKHEHCAASGVGLSRKKRGSTKEPIPRQRRQKISDYVQINLERLICGHLHLSTVITMFSNHRNVPSLHEFVESTVMFLKTRYNPKFEHVISVFHALCDDVRGNPREVDPLDGSFPPALLRPECQMLALFLHVCQFSKVMAPLLVELNKALYQTLLQEPLKFHKLSAFCRIIAAVCRLQGDSTRVLFLAFDLLKKPLSISELPVMAALASVWPAPLARKRGVKLLENRQISLRGLEQQPMSYTLEVLVMTMLRTMEGNVHARLPANLLTLCQWSGGHHGKVTALTDSLVKILKSSDEVYIVSPLKTAATSSGPTPWHRPRPSVLAFHIVHCLRALSHCQGWVWTNDTLIRAHLWPLLQQWNAKQDSVREATIVCTVRLIGFISQQGLSHDLSSSSLGQLQRVLVALLNKSDQISFPIQLAAVDSLLELCPQGHPRSQELVGVVRAWLKKQAGKPHERFLFQEFSPRVQAIT